MKSYFSIFLIIVIFGLNRGYAQTAPSFTQMPQGQAPMNIQGEQPVDVPDTVVKQFVKDFTNADHSEWKKDGNNLVAIFDESDGNVRALYKTDGTLLRTTRTLDAKVLPQPASDYISKKYPNYKFTTVSRITERNGVTHYEVKIGKDKSDFDVYGNIIKPKTTTTKTGTSKTTKK